MKLKLLSLLATASLLTACAYDDGYYGHSNQGYGYPSGGYGTYHQGYGYPYGYNRAYGNHPSHHHKHNHQHNHKNNHDYRHDGQAHRQKPIYPQRQSNYRQPRPQEYSQNYKGHPAHPDANKYQRYNDLNRRAFPDRGKDRKRD